MICCITGKRLVVREFTAIITKRKIRITLFYLSRGTAKAKVSITKLNRERNNLPIECTSVVTILNMILSIFLGYYSLHYLFQASLFKDFFSQKKSERNFYANLYKNDTFLNNVKRLIPNEGFFFPILQRLLSRK